MPNTRRSDCPLSCFLDEWGDKWTFVILRDALAGPKKFKGFLESDEALPTNLLSSRLARLVEGGYLVKAQYQEKPKRFEYAITEKGRSLIPIMQAMVGWAEAHLDGLGPAPACLADASAAMNAPVEKAAPKPKAKKKPAAKAEPAPLAQGAFDF